MDDEGKLRACLQWAEEHEDEAPFAEAFADMLARLENGRMRHFSQAQSAWIRGIHEKLFDEPEYSNEWSAGKVPRGLKEVPTPEVLQNLPKRPPGR